MSDLDVSKMKVTELRAALLERGLDTKGVKPILQERLNHALENEAVDSPAPESVGEEIEGEDEENGEESVDEIAEEATELPEPDEVPEQDESEKQQQEEAEQEEAEQEEAVEQIEPVLTEEPPAELMEEDQTEAEKITKEEEPEVKPEPELMQSESEPVQSEQEPMQSEEAPATEEPMQAEVKEEEIKEEETKEENNTTEVKKEEIKEEEIKEEDKDAVKEEGGEKTDETKDGNKDSKKDSKESKHDEKEDRDREKRGDRDRSRRDRRDRSPRRRSPSPVVMEEDDGIPETQCVLSKYISDLNMKVAKDGYSAAPISTEGFAYLWSGVKSTHGVTKGKVCYQVKLVEHQNVKHLPSEEKNPHVVRVGWSLNKSTLQLGEEEFSYGFGGTAKFSVQCKFSDFGETFGEGDVITTYLDFDAEKPTISYSKNDKDLGVAHTIEEDLEGAALFPHLLVKNTSIEINFGQKEEPYFPVTEGYTFIASLPQEDQVRGPVPPAEKKDCEIVMMVGLPGAGKTTWAEKFCSEHPDKKYYVLGTNLIMEKMKVMGLRRQRNYAGRFDLLIEKSTKCLNKFFEMAPRKKRNYILDQTNVYPSARRRKMRPFEGFESKAIVLVPTDEEFKKRIEKRTKEEGKDVPDHAVLEMKANFELPEKGVLFNNVDFVELALDKAKPLVDQYRKEGQDKLGPNYRRFNRDRNRGGGNRDRSRFDKSPRGGYSNYGGNRGGGGGGGGNNSGRYGGGGGGYGNHGGGYKDNRSTQKGGREGGSGGYGSGYGSGGYGSGYGSGGYGGKQGYQGGSYGSQGGGYNQSRNSNYNQSSGGYGSAYNRGYGSSSSQSTPSSYSSQGYSSGAGYDNQGYQNQQYQQQYAQYQQQYQQYYQQQQQNQSYNPYANYYSNYNTGGSSSNSNSGYGQSR